MSFDQHSLFGYSTVLSVGSQTGTTLVFNVQTGDGVKFGLNQQLTFWPANTPFPLLSNAMVARVTAIATDQITCDVQVASREGSTTRTVLVGDQVMNSISPKVFTDVESVINTGWNPLSATFIWSAVDGHTFVATTSSDLTGLIGVGNKVKLTNQAAVQYFFVTAITASTITLYGGTTYSITNTTITLPFFSNIKAPFGFPLNPATWTEELFDITRRTQSSPVVGTWYNLTESLVIPIGLWRVEYFIGLYGNPGASAGTAYLTLSTANNSESDIDFTSAQSYTASTNFIGPVHSKAKILSLASKTTYYANAKTDGASLGSINFVNDFIKLFIRAICVYL